MRPVAWARKAEEGRNDDAAVALGALQSVGRFGACGEWRLDQQRYKYALCGRIRCEVQDVGRRSFGGIGPALFFVIGLRRWRSSMVLRAGRESVQGRCEPLKLEALAPGDDRLMLRAAREIRSVQSSQADALHADQQHRRCGAVAAYLAGCASGGFEAPVVCRKGLRVGSGLKDLPSHAISIAAGWWTVGIRHATESIAWMSFIAKNKDLEKAVKSPRRMCASSWATRGRSVWIVRRVARRE